MILKSTLAVVAVATSCLGAWKAYKVYGIHDTSLLMENLEALTLDGDAGALDDMYEVKGDKNGKCIKFKSFHSVCPERGSQPEKHGDKCEIVTYTTENGGFTYEKKMVNTFLTPFYDKWESKYGRCPNTYTRYDLEATVLPPPTEHTYASNN